MCLAGKTGKFRMILILRRTGHALFPHSALNSELSRVISACPFQLLHVPISGIIASVREESAERIQHGPVSGGRIM